jgi:hypothetical protein
MKQWHVPQLIVLVRVKSSESILAACKVEPNVDKGPESTNLDCQVLNEECSSCIEQLSS